MVIESEKEIVNIVIIRRCNEWLFENKVLIQLSFLSLWKLLITIHLVLTTDEYCLHKEKLPMLWGSFVQAKNK